MRAHKAASSSTVGILGSLTRNPASGADLRKTAMATMPSLPTLGILALQPQDCQLAAMVKPHINHGVMGKDAIQGESYGYGALVPGRGYGHDRAHHPGPWRLPRLAQRPSDA